MKIAMIASEAAPFVKTGGLGDVLQALPDELARVEGNEVALFLPYYKTIKQNPEIADELEAEIKERLLNGSHSGEAEGEAPAAAGRAVSISADDFED